jgi:sialidase-1
MTVRLSRDDGASWPHGKLLYEPSSAYSCLAVLPHDQVGIVFERDGYSRLSFTSFSLTWLEGK